MIADKSFKVRLAELVGKDSSRTFERRCGVNEASIRNYLKGTSEPTLGNLIKIATACGVSVGWLAAGEGEPKQRNGIIAATIEPGDEGKKARRLAAGARAERRSPDLQRLIAWMDEEQEKNPDFGYFLARQLEKTYPSFARYLDNLEEKKEPGHYLQVAEPEDKYNSDES
jgi:transcriptional regulator with XRE-family HTH domain